MKQKSKLKITFFLSSLFLLTTVIAVYIICRFTVIIPFAIDKNAGNTAGNLYNKGIFCEYNNKIYFSNSYDNGYLYVMNPDGSNIKKLFNHTASYINVSGKYIYYAYNTQRAFSSRTIFRDKQFYINRLDTDGKNLLTLDEKASGTIRLSNNRVFYQGLDNQDVPSLRSISFDGTKEQDLIDKGINPSCIVDDIIYYNDASKNYNLMSIDIKSGKSSVLYDGACSNPVYDDNYVYFIDLDHNSTLARINLSTLEKETLYAKGIATYNLYNDYIYYQTSDTTDPRLYRIKKDGSENTSILSGNFCNINVTSNFVYFNQLGYDTPIYRIATSGSIDVTRFDEAADAIKP